MGFVPDEIVPKAEVFILMQNPGDTEEREGRPACGSTGKTMDEAFLPLAQLERGKNVSVGNILKCRWAGDNALPDGPLLSEAVLHCTQTHLQIPESTRLVVSQGAVGFKYVSQGRYYRADGRPATVSDYRGFVLPDALRGIPVFQVLHIAGLDRASHKRGKGGLTPAQRWVAQHIDWPKIPRILNGTIPAALPERVIFTADSYQPALDWFTFAHTCQYLVLDTEYIVNTQYLTMLGMLGVHADGREMGLQIDWETAEGWIKDIVRVQVHRLVKTKPTVLQNFQADIPVLESSLGIPSGDWLDVDDTIQMHGTMWCEMPHGLEYTASVYGVHPKMKHLSKSDPLLYNFGDVVDTNSVYKGIKKEYAVFPSAATTYYERQKPLIPIWLAGPIKHGLRINTAAVETLIPEREHIVKEASHLAESFAGKTFNLGSGQQVAEYLYADRGYPVQIDKDSGNVTTDEEAVATLRRLIGPAFDPEVDLTLDMALERIRHGADPILELKVVYTTADTDLTTYLRRLVTPNGKVVDRVYPSIGMPQKTGRWAMVDPPVSTTPPHLRVMYTPDAGCCWAYWDWKGIELYVLRYLTGSKVLADSQDKGMDLHTWTVCVLLGYPFPPNLVEVHKSPENEAWRQHISWKGKDDPRRIFAKTARYEINYGGTGANAAEQAAQYGLDPRVLKKAVQGLIRADTEYFRWRNDVEAQVKKTRVTTSFMGRPWIHLGYGQSIVREALDHPMQSAVVDIAHTVMIEIWRRHKQDGVRFSHGLHDSQYWSVPINHHTDHILQSIRSVAEMEFTINGQKVHFPVDWGVQYADV
jgi:uracil-DNA glycosylase family 4